jgi:DNA-directed RNA polymerase alpha subunit
MVAGIRWYSNRPLPLPRAKVVCAIIDRAPFDPDLKGSYFFFDFMKKYTLLSCIESKMIHPTQLYGRFELGQFAPGQAVTVANTLRRALLSQLPGVAITLVHIANVSHEYESVPGIQEPVLDILSNLKKIVFTSEFETFQPQVGYVHLKGPAVVRAGDLKLPFFISCVHPEQYITTLTEHGDFRLVVLINSGKQYLNHTPNSTGYRSRVSFLQQQMQKLGSPYLATQHQRFYQNWEQQRKMGSAEHLTQVASFVQSKLAQKLWEQQQTSQQTQFIDKASRLIKTSYPKPHLPRRSPSAWAQHWLHAFQTRADKSYAEALQKKYKQLPQNAKMQKLHLYEYEAMKGLRSLLNTKGNYLPVNAFFSPVTKVNYTIVKEENRVGETVRLEVWTNGSIDPRRAIHRSVKALIKLFLPFQLVEQTEVTPVKKKMKQRNTRQIQKATFKKHVAQSVIQLQSVSSSKQNQLMEPELFNAFLQRLKKKQVIKPLRRKSLKNRSRRWPKQWPQHQQRRRAPLYTYVQPLAKVIRPDQHVVVQQRQLLRHFRMFFPLFNIIDRFINHYGLTSSQYTKLGLLNILNLELPVNIYTFLWQHKVQTIEDLFFMHYEMINQSIPINKKISFYRAFHNAFSKLFYQWTGNTESKAKIITQQRYKKQDEEQQQKEQQQKEQQAQAKKRAKKMRQDRKRRDAELRKSRSQKNKKQQD